MPLKMAGQIKPGDRIQVFVGGTPKGAFVREVREDEEFTLVRWERPGTQDEGIESFNTCSNVMVVSPR